MVNKIEFLTYIFIKGKSRWFNFLSGIELESIQFVDYNFILKKEETKCVLLTYFKDDYMQTNFLNYHIYE